jgi:hypothetical protein
MQQIFYQIISIKRMHIDHRTFFKNKDFRDILTEYKDGAMSSYYKDLYDRRRCLSYYIICLMNKDCGEISIIFHTRTRKNFLYKCIQPYEEYVEPKLSFSQYKTTKLNNCHQMSGIYVLLKYPSHNECECECRLKLYHERAI